jgi:hypothetical protein
MDSIHGLNWHQGDTEQIVSIGNRHLGSETSVLFSIHICQGPFEHGASSSISSGRSASCVTYWIVSDS